MLIDSGKRSNLRVHFPVVSGLRNHEAALEMGTHPFQYRNHRLRAHVVLLNIDLDVIRTVTELASTVAIKICKVFVGIWGKEETMLFSGEALQMIVQGREELLLRGLVGTADVNIATAGVNVAGEAAD